MHLFIFSVEKMYYLHKTTSASSCVKPNASQWEATLRDDVGFATVYRRIYRRKFLTLSNQTSRYIRDCIRMFVLHPSFFWYFWWLWHFLGIFTYFSIAFPPSIMKTYLYNFDPLKPHFYIVKLGFTGLNIIFLISAQKHRLWVLIRTASVLTSTHNPGFEQKYEKYQSFVSENL